MGWALEGWLVEGEEYRVSYAILWVCGFGIRWESEWADKLVVWGGKLTASAASVSGRQLVNVTLCDEKEVVLGEECLRNGSGVAGWMDR